jgi:hypothetical protein
MFCLISRRCLLVLVPPALRTWQNSDAETVRISLSNPALLEYERKRSAPTHLYAQVKPLAQVKPPRRGRAGCGADWY